MSTNSVYFKPIIIVALITTFILMIPLIAMQFTNEVDWNIFDFIVAGILIFGTGITFKIITMKVRSNYYKAAFGLSIGTAFLLIWSNLAVGIIGSENNPANLLYFGVIAIGFFGSINVKFKPRGMSHTMFATAIAMMLVPTIAILIWKPETDSVEAIPGILGVFVLNAFFAMLFVGSALLFRQAEQEKAINNK